MPRESVALFAFNRGLVSTLALARTDLKRLALSAETFTNFMARSLGPMMLRAGTEYIGASNDNAAARYLPFVFSTSDKAILEITDSTLRVWVDDELITRGSVSTAVANGSFTSDVASWTDDDEAGGTSAWVTGGYLGLTGNGTAAAKRSQQVTVASADQNDEHALTIVIERGPVVFRCGSSSGGDEYISETTLGTGTHSLAFTPTGDFYLEFSSRLKRQVLVDSCTVEAAGTMEVAAPWAAADLAKIRGGVEQQSGDIQYIACSGYQQYKIERRGTHSWSVVKYEPEDGPFRLTNTGPITLTPSALSGNITIAASAPLFKSTNVGSLWRITSSGQQVEADVTAEDQYTNAIRVTGIDTQRIFTIVREGTWVATVTLQRSLDSDTGPWEDVTTYATNDTITYDDGLDNQIAWYRIGVKTGDFTSGTVELTLNYAIGYVDGVVRVTAYTDEENVSAEVITDLGGTDATDDWAEGRWSERRGFPTSGTFVEGRLQWAGGDGIWLSVSDAFESFDDTVEGDSAPISRSIGSGPVDDIHWSLALGRLLVGSEGAEFVCKSSSLDEPLTVTNFSIKSGSSRGSAAVQAVKIDRRGAYVQAGGTRLMELGLGEDYEYDSTDLTFHVPEVCQPSIVRVVVQRQPDTRLHCVLSDGTVAILLREPKENLLCWLAWLTDGEVEDAVVLPGESGDDEDAVYYHINRTIDGSTVRYLEKWALESECQGGTLNKQADCFTTFTNSPASATVTDLSHLEGESVVVWADSKCLTDADGEIATFTVSGGQITLTNGGESYSASSGVVGKGYTAQWKSAKLAYASGAGTALMQKKILQHIGILLYNTHHKGIQYGPSFDYLDDLPQVKDGAAVDDDTVHSTYDEEFFEFPGEWDTDARICLQAKAPRPVTILGVAMPVETHDKA